MLFGKRHVQLVLGQQELCDVLASNERLLEVKEADFYFMNLAALLQVYALGIDLAVRWIDMDFLKKSLLGGPLNMPDIHENFA